MLSRSAAFVFSSLTASLVVATVQRRRLHVFASDARYRPEYRALNSSRITLVQKRSERLYVRH